MRMTDIFGKALYSYWKGDRKTPYFIERDDGFSEKHSLSNYFTRTPSDIELRLLKEAKGKVLDVGCGAGRHTLYLQKKGYDVTGFDFSPLAIKVCKERGCKKVKVDDVFNAKTKDRCFDTILLFGNNLGIGGSVKGTVKLLKELKKTIKPDGILLLTSLDPTKTKQDVYLNYRKRNLKIGRDLGTVKIRVKYKGETSDWFNWFNASPSELEKIAKKSNWEISKTYISHNGGYSAMLTPLENNT